MELARDQNSQYVVTWQIPKDAPTEKHILVLEARTSSRKDGLAFELVVLGYRKWTSAAGDVVATDARFDVVQGEDVVLKTRRGTRVVVALGDLADEERRHVEDVRALLGLGE